MADTTSTGKERFEVLDGLRGTAALLVVLFHIQGITVGFSHKGLWLNHAYLAVDFFFVLSGFVVGYAYDDRWPSMSVLDFFKIRLIRLHPLVVLGAMLGLASYVLDPFGHAVQNTASDVLFVTFILSALVLPAKPLPNRWSDTHTLNGPSWSLLQEYIGNIAYALVLRRLSSRILGLLSVISAVVLIGCAISIGTLDRGYAYENFWMAPVRLFFPFITGLWLYRVRDRLPQIQLGYLFLSALLIVAFIVPTLPVVAGINLNGIYEGICVVLLFPAIVMAGAHSHAGRGMVRLCQINGAISYPIYITHFPFMYIWMNYFFQKAPSPAAAAGIAVALFFFTILVAWAAYTFWDLPIRRWLSCRLLKTRNFPIRSNAIRD